MQRLTFAFFSPQHVPVEFCSSRYLSVPPLPYLRLPSSISLSARLLSVRLRVSHPDHRAASLFIYYFISRRIKARPRGAGTQSLTPPPLLPHPLFSPSIKFNPPSSPHPHFPAKPDPTLKWMDYRPLCVRVCLVCEHAHTHTVTRGAVCLRACCVLIFFVLQDKRSRRVRARALYIHV